MFNTLNDDREYVNNNRIQQYQQVIPLGLGFEWHFEQRFEKMVADEHIVEGNCILEITVPN